MPNISRHGGGCCGVRHYVGFYSSRNSITGEQIARELSSFPLSTGGRSRGKLIEAVITDNQFRNQPDLAQIMKDAGFKLVSRFYNNSGGMCNVLHRVSGSREISRCNLPWVKTLR